MAVYSAIFVLYVLGVCSSLSANQDLSVVEVAKRIVDGHLEGKSFSESGSNNREPLQFKFNDSSHINGWWCVRMLEASLSWQDNYLCTNRDIGLTWINPFRCESSTKLKCTHTLDTAEVIWSDNALCLPVDSKVELVWSYCGAIPSMSCVQLYDPNAPGSHINDNYVCWKEHTN